ncbi:MAG: hypothetical protein WAM14_17750 [Candidatus Nitrosopolaris sp.]
MSPMWGSTTINTSHLYKDYDLLSSALVLSIMLAIASNVQDDEQIPTYSLAMCGT